MEWKRLAVVGSAWLLVIVCLSLRLVEPTRDGDIFWHLAYAEQMLKSGNPTIAHGQFSWLEQDIPEIYCAWLGQLALYSVYQQFDFEGLIALRYVVFALCLVLMVSLAGKKLTTDPRVILMFALWGVSCYIGFGEKPQLFSLLLFNLLWLFACLERLERISYPLFVGLAALTMVVWVNTHGAFLFGLILLTTREFDAPTRARPLRLVALPLYLLTTLMTPYGLSYPVGIIKSYLRPAAHSMHTNQVSEWLSIFDARLADLHLPLLFGAWLLTTCWCQYQHWKSGDPIALLLSNLAFFALALLYARAFIFLPTAALYSFIFTIKVRKLDNSVSTGPRIALLSLLAVVCLGSVYEWRTNPAGYLWPGFGVDRFTNPVEEAEFIERLEKSGNLYNGYNGGAYLLWKLNPKWKVLVDSRAFPYTQNFNEIWAFLGGQVAEFVRLHPTDLAVIPHENPACVTAFINLDGWRPVFVGPSAVIFSADPQVPITQSLDDLNQIPQRIQSRLAAMYLCQTFLTAGQIEVAQLALTRARELPGKHETDMDGLQAFIQGEIARVAGDLTTAIKLHERCFQLGGYRNPVTLRNLYLTKLQNTESPTEKRELEARLKNLIQRGDPFAR